MTDNPYIMKHDGTTTITDAGQKWLTEHVTDSTSQVYGFTNELPVPVIAAAMARLSRRAGDMRLALLEEFAPNLADADALIHRVVTAYGDDSVQQLAPLQVVVEGASNVLTKLLEWGRLGSYLEQSTRYIFFDQRDENGAYNYFRPGLPSDLLDTYVSTLDTIFDLYSEMVRGIADYVRTETPCQNPDDRAERTAWMGATRAQACDAVRPVLPAATKSTVGIVGSAQAIDNLIMHLLSEPLTEAQDIGRQLLGVARRVMPAFFERTDMPGRGGAITAYRANTRTDVRVAAENALTHNPALRGKPVELIDYWPRNELDLLPGMLFESSQLPMSEIRRQVQSMSRAKQLQLYFTYFGERLNRRHRPGRALEKAHFEFEFNSDYGTFRDLQRHRMVDAMEWQRLTPFQGFEIPDLVKRASFKKEFRHCFSLSHRLFEKLAEAGYEVEAQYATLLGHRMRYRMIINLREAFHLIELRSGPAGHPGYRKLAQSMYHQLRKVYPIAAGQMIFVGLGEDEALTRLAAERATQFKLSKL